jgi:hypothetical protein
MFGARRVARRTGRRTARRVSRRRELAQHYRTAFRARGMRRPALASGAAHIPSGLSI